MHFIKLLTANKHHDQRSILCFFFPLLHDNSAFEAKWQRDPSLLTLLS